MLEKLKKRMKERLETDAFKTVHNRETVYMKKTGWPYKEWRQIHPPVNEDNTWNIPNLIFGGKANAFRLLVMVLIVGVILLAFANLLEQISTLREALSYCLNPLQSNPGQNLTNLG